MHSLIHQARTSDLIENEILMLLKILLALKNGVASLESLDQDFIPCIDFFILCGTHQKLQSAILAQKMTQDTTCGFNHGLFIDQSLKDSHLILLSIVIWLEFAV